MFHRYALILALSLLTGMSSAQAETRWYQVELVIFAQTGNPYGHMEKWPEDLVMPDLDGARELKPVNAGRKSAYQALSHKQMGLNNIWDKIRQSSRYTPLLYTGWRQPGLAANKSVAVHIHDGSIRIKPEAAHTEETSSAALPQELPLLDGSLRLVLAHYLYLHTDLVYREPLHEADDKEVEALPLVEENQDSNNTGLQGESADQATQAATEQLTLPKYRSYHLQTTRKMRSKELHYIDHPAFGIIVRVMPLNTD